MWYCYYIVFENPVLFILLFSITTVKFEATYYNYDHYEEDKNWAL